MSMVVSGEAWGVVAAKCPQIDRHVCSVAGRYHTIGLLWTAEAILHLGFCASAGVVVRAQRRPNGSTHPRTRFRAPCTSAPSGFKALTPLKFSFRRRSGTSRLLKDRHRGIAAQVWGCGVHCGIRQDRLRLEHCWYALTPFVLSRPWRSLASERTEFMLRWSHVRRR